MNLIERLARAIAVAAGENPDENIGSLYHPEDRVIWLDYEPHARAVLASLRDYDPFLIKTELPKPMAFDDAWRELFETALSGDGQRAPTLSTP